MSPSDLENLLGEVEPGRRDFLKKLIFSMGYATPIISVFTMEALNIDTAMAQVSNICSNLGEVQIEKTSSPNPVIAGEQLTYTVKLHACGQPADRMSFSDPLPAGSTFVSAQQTSGNVQFNLTLPNVGTEGGTVSGTAASAMLEGDIAIFEIVVQILP